MYRTVTVSTITPPNKVSHIQEVGYPKLSSHCQRIDRFQTVTQPYKIRCEIFKKKTDSSIINEGGRLKREPNLTAARQGLQPSQRDTARHSETWRGTTRHSEAHGDMT